MFEEKGMRIGYIIICVTAVGFVCSLTYNCGYFWLFDAGVRVLSIGDILTSYTLWVPGLGTLLFAYSLDKFLEYVEIRQESAKTKRQQKNIQDLFSIIHGAIFIALLIFLYASIIHGFMYRPILVWLSACYVILSVLGIASNKKVLPWRKYKFIQGIFLFIPVMLSLMFALGMDRALSDSKLTAPNINLFFINNTVPYPTILLRHLEKGLLAKDLARKNYILFSWEDVSRIEIIANKNHFTGILKAD